MDTIRNKAAEVSGKTVEEEDKKAEEKEAPKKSNDADELFEKLAQPQVKSKKAKETAKQPEKIQENFDGYNSSERINLDRLIENSLD